LGSPFKRLVVKLKELMDKPHVDVESLGPPGHTFKVKVAMWSTHTVPPRLDLSKRVFLVMPKYAAITVGISIWCPS